MFLDLFNRKAPEFLCHVKFKNTIPEPVIDSKLVVRTPELKKFAPYRVTSIEQEYQHEAPFEVLKTPLLDFVDLEKFKPGMNSYLAAEDEMLVKPIEGGGKEVKENKEGGGGGKGQRSEVTWLRRTEYLVNESGRSFKANHQSLKDHLPNDDPLTSVKKKAEMKLERKLDVIEAIERSFQYEPDMATLRHPNNSMVKAIEVYPIIPGNLEDFDDTFAQCTFEAEPTSSNNELIDNFQVIENGEQHAIIKAMNNVDNPKDTFVWYYLPIGLEEGKEKYVFVRDYDIQKVDRQSNPYYVLSIPQENTGGLVKQGKDTTVTFTSISGHFSLKKRRSRIDQSRQRHCLKVTRIQ